MAMSFREAEYAGWTARAESYDTLFTTISNQAIPHILAALGDLSGKAVLDVCCGPGHLAAAAVQRGASAEGIDFAPTMIARAARNYPTIPFHEGDAESLPYGSGSFDHVVCAFGIMHLQQPEAAIAEAHRVLRPSGIYAFTQWALNDDLLRIVSAAIAEHGRSDLDIPQAPPPMRFSDPDECRRVLRIYGFREIRIEQITLQWRTDRAEALLELIYSSAVRAALLLEAQEPEQRACIHKAIIDAVTAQSDGRDLLIRRPAVLASGIKLLGR
jgi:ubiquinone/menaquinone biosynthesis C-methylase UbiE